MKNYIVTRTKDGILLTCESLDKKGQVVRTVPSGPFDSGNASKQSKALALAIAMHYMGATPEDLAATAEAQRRAPQILDAFLLHHNLPLNAHLEISSDVLDRFFALASQPA